eukprot:gb/GEZN01004842.1/.p1 GENE.gb/GEZN01004842.1/~~gb/GEZN01004842.1/.p1  ORF type:complete len:597 (+),score=97.85 gb/GEZN01004842.1/:49-1839(+)
MLSQPLLQGDLQANPVSSALRPVVVATGLLFTGVSGWLATHRFLRNPALPAPAIPFGNTGEVWQKFDSDRNGYLTFAEVAGTLALNYPVLVTDHAVVQRAYQEADTDRNNRLTKQEFSGFVRHLQGAMSQTILRASSSSDAVGGSIFVPKEGLDKVVAKAGPPGLLQLVGLSGLTSPKPSCFFSYGSLGEYVETRSACADGAKVKEGWLYGARLGVGSVLAEITGQQGDLLKGRLVCWPTATFEKKRKEVESVFQANHASFGRGVQSIVTEDGSSVQAQVFFQAFHLSPSMPLPATVLAALSVALAPCPLPAAASLFHWVGPVPDNLGVHANQLSSCETPTHCAREDWYVGDPSTALHTLVPIIKGMEDVEIVEQTDDYVHATATSKLFGFVDDVEFFADKSGKVLQARSTSRMGDSDMGVNSKRLADMHTLLELFNPPDETNPYSQASAKSYGDIRAQYGDATPNTKAEGQKYLEAHNKEEGVITLPSGLQYKVLRSGPEDGRSPGLSSPTLCDYEGRLINGKVFDSSYKRGEPLTCAPKQVIKGWTEAMQLMKEGDKWELTIPPELGYGERGAGAKIPGGAVLIFELEMIKVLD